MGQTLSNVGGIQTQTLNVTQQLIKNATSELKLSTNPKAPELITKYDTLSNSVTTTINDISGMSSELLTAKQNQFNSQLIELNIEKTQILQGTATLYGKQAFKIITYSASIIFAVIIISHVFIDKSIVFKIFYCVWGALLYPLVILYGVYNAPNWKAVLIPLMPITENDEGWKSNVVISTVMWPFKYNAQPDPDDIKNAKSKYALQAFSFVCVICFGIAYVI